MHVFVNFVFIPFHIIFFVILLLGLVDKWVGEWKGSLGDVPPEKLRNF